MIQATTLPNGIRIITEHCDFSEKTAICCHFNIGSIHETREQNGLAHVLEHLIFEGTQTRSAFELNKAARRLGMSIDGETTYDSIRFNGTVRNEKATDLITLLADMLQHPALDEQSFQKEKKVILSEMAAYEDDSEEQAANMIFKAAYKHQSLGLPREGTLKTISNLKRADALSFYQQYYTSGNLIISAAGGIRHEDFVHLCASLFTDLKAAPATPVPPVRYLGGNQRNEKASDQLDYFFLALEGVSVQNIRDYYLANMLAETLNNKLYDEIREEKGLVYTIAASNTAFQNTGLFSINSACYPSVSNQVVHEICRITTGLAASLTPEDLKIAKETAKLDILGSQDSMMDRAEGNVFDLNLFGRPLPLQESFQIIDSIKADDMCQMMRSLLKSRLSCSVHSSYPKKFMSYESIAERLQTGSNQSKIPMLNARETTHSL